MEAVITWFAGMITACMNSAGCALAHGRIMDRMHGTIVTDITRGLQKMLVQRWTNQEPACLGQSVLRI